MMLPNHHTDHAPARARGLQLVDEVAALVDALTSTDLPSGRTLARPCIERLVERVFLGAFVVTRVAKHVALDVALAMARARRNESAP